MDQPLTFVINPLGSAARSELRVWNTGDQRLKLVHFAGCPPSPPTPPNFSGYLRHRLTAPGPAEPQQRCDQGAHNFVMQRCRPQLLLSCGGARRQVAISEKDEQEEGGTGRLRSRFARSAIQETDGSRLQSVVMQPPLRFTTTLTGKRRAPANECHEP